MNREAAARLRELGIQLDVTARLGSLSLGTQQLVEIARVVFSGATVIILDEPTSALSAPEAERLFAFMRELRARGRSLIFISHFLEDVLAVADRVTVLKNAHKVATLPAQGLTKHRLIELMIGRDATSLAASYEAGVQLPPPVESPPVLEISGLTAFGAFSDISLTVHAGEILGIFGFLGAGMTEVARALFGRVRPHGGTIRLNGQTIQPVLPSRGHPPGHRLPDREPPRHHLPPPRDLQEHHAGPPEPDRRADLPPPRRDRGRGTPRCSEPASARPTRRCGPATSAAATSRRWCWRSG